MATIEVTEEMKENIETLAEAEGLSVDRYLYKALRTVRFFQKEWFPENEGIKEESVVHPEPPEKEVPVKEDPHWVEVDGERLEGKSIRDVYRKFLGKVGCRRIFDSYPEGKRSLIFTAPPEGRHLKLFEKVTEGRYTFWVYTCLSKQAYLRFLRVVGETMNIKIEHN